MRSSLVSEARLVLMYRPTCGDIDTLCAAVCHALLDVLAVVSVGDVEYGSLTSRTWLRGRRYTRCGALQQQDAGRSTDAEARISLSAYRPATAILDRFRRLRSAIVVAIGHRSHITLDSESVARASISYPASAYCNSASCSDSGRPSVLA